MDEEPRTYLCKIGWELLDHKRWTKKVEDKINYLWHRMECPECQKPLCIGDGEDFCGEVATNISGKGWPYCDAHYALPCGHTKDDLVWDRGDNRCKRCMEAR